MVEKKEKIKCKSYIGSFKAGVVEIKKCNKYATNDEDTCNSHKYLNNLTDIQLDEIKNGEWVFCKRCIHFIEKSVDKKFIPRCDSCLNYRKLQHKKDVASKKSDKCNWKDRNLDQCRNFGQENGYCKNHQYVADYTETEKKNSKMCKGCKKVKYLGDFGSCDVCRNRGKKNRVIVKETIVKCKKDTCNSKVKENGYCGKHQRIWMKKKLDEIGTHKTCTNFIRGCDAILEIYNEFKKCEDCRKNDRENDKKNRKSKIIIIEDNDKQQCTFCFKIKDISQFIGSRERITKTCYDCRLAFSEADSKRPDRERDYSEYDSRPEVKERKEQWKDDNYEKVAIYDLEYKHRQMEEQGEDYWKNNAQDAKKRRAKNPEKCKENNMKKKLDPKQKYNYYKRSALHKGRQYKLTYDESKKMFFSNCYYCNVSADKDIVLNGIDCKYNEGDYEIDNCVPCCSICNYIKGDRFDDGEFIKFSEHILTNLQFIDGKLHNEIFKNIGSSDYKGYKQSAKIRKKEFNLTKLEFLNIINNNCYLCGKNNENHNNGIDRINNDIGYEIRNCLSCCGTCNKSKKEYELIKFINKLVNIYKNHFNKKINIKIDNNLEKKLIKQYGGKMEITQEDLKNKQKEREKIRKQLYRKKKKQSENNNTPKRKKLTNDEIKERARIRQQESRLRMKEKYGNDEYKKKKALEAQERRRNKKINVDIT
jgi:hypothetical protein